jgi:hypothetical protein
MQAKNVKKIIFFTFLLLFPAFMSKKTATGFPDNSFRYFAITIIVFCGFASPT